MVTESMLHPQHLTHRTSTGVIAITLALCVWAGVGGGCAARDVAVRDIVVTEHRVDDDGFRRTVGALVARPATEGNHIRVLQNGDEIFPAMLDAIRGAQDTINLETFIYWRGDIADSFAAALCDRAEAGVDVHVLIDDIGGTKMDRALVLRMRDSGVDLRFYNPVITSIFQSPEDINYRTHRKLLIVDGVVGFTGGVGIGKEWTGDAQSPDHWRDCHFEIVGPAVSELQGVFAENWLQTTGELLSDAQQFPMHLNGGDKTVQVLGSAPEDRAAPTQTMFLLAIAAARESIDIATPYFVPDDVTRRQLVDAMERGAQLRLLLPGPVTDHVFVSHASSDMWGSLLEHGAEIHLYQPTLMHSKFAVIDGFWTVLGSANFDNRSFRLNDEAVVIVYNEAFAAEMTDVFENDLLDSKTITLDEWRDRGMHIELFDEFASWFSGWL